MCFITQLINAKVIAKNALQMRIHTARTDIFFIFENSILQ